MKTGIGKWETANAVEQSKACWKYKDPFTEVLGGEFNVINQSFHDLHHCFSVVIADILGLVSNSGQMKFSRFRKDIESKKLLRFVDARYRTRNERLPWACSSTRLAQVNRIIESVRFPSGQEEMKPVGEYMKMAQKIKLAGPRGRWLLSIMDMDSDYKEKFIAVLDIMHELRQKPPLTETRKEELKIHIPETFAWLEWKLPSYWCTITKHMFWENFLCQLCEIGSFWALGLLSIEQYHLVMKKLARGRKNMMASFVNNYTTFENVQIDWSHFEDTANDPTPGDLVARRPPRDALQVVIVRGFMLLSCYFHATFMPLSC